MPSMESRIFLCTEAGLLQQALRQLPAARLTGPRHPLNLYEHGYNSQCSFTA